MSEAMTNREIEDVLSSIRRLVSQEGGRHDAPRPEPGRLILTAAQRVDAPAADPQAADVMRSDAAPVVSGGPDLRQLEATIAELEAAVSASDSAWEPDGSEAGASVASAAASNVTALYARPNFVHRPAAAEPVSVEGAVSPPTAQPHAAVMPPPDPAPPMAEGAAVVDDAVRDEADGIEETVIDEAMLRALVSQMVREELHGQLGERITLQVRKLVRAEIARVLDERKLI